MDIRLYVISISAMLHDVGKFVYDYCGIDKDYIQKNQQLYQPVFKGRYTHTHALYTAGFIELNRHLFPAELFSSDLGQDNLINLSGMHHKPETPMQLIITVSDRISSGMDRDYFEEGEDVKIKDFKKTRLFPLFEQINFKEQDQKRFSSKENFKWCYELTHVFPTSIFPVKRTEVERNEDQYLSLYTRFVKALKSLAHKNNIFLWMQHFESIYKKYTFFIPSVRVGKAIPDVSLYNHSKTTASLATALYKFHKDTDTLNEKDIKDENEEKFLIIAGDFYGIQKFIFSSGGEATHHRSKLLRGRSFAVSLICQISAFELITRLGLTPYSVLLNSAGKFYILAPNLKETEEKIKEIEEDINNWLVKNTFGETSLGLSTTKARPFNFKPPLFKQLWEKVQENLQEKKFYRLNPKYTGVITSYLDSFINDLNDRLCPLCGKRPSHKECERDELIYEGKKGSSCKLCRDHIMLGTNLVKDYRIGILRNCDLKKFNEADKKRTLKEPILGKYQVIFTNKNNLLNEFVRKNELVMLLDVNLKDDGSIPEEITFLPLNGYVPVYTKEDLKDKRLQLRKLKDKSDIKEGLPKTFNDISLLSLREESEDEFFGIDAIGILKADVDDLGLIFGCGFLEERYTISRLHSLSVQLNNFFSMYLPHLLKTTSEFKNIYTVFAGGDDLFLIGPWDRIVDFSIKIKRDFSIYVCNNSNIHLSAGTYLAKSHVPVTTISTEAEKALKQAKNKDIENKNCISIFQRPMKWDEFIEIMKFEDEFLDMLEKGMLSKSMMYKLNEIVFMAEEELKILDKKTISIADIHNLKWRAILNYFLARNLKLEDENKVEEIISHMVKLVDDFRGDLIVPIWSVLYKKRKFSVRG